MRCGVCCTQEVCLLGVEAFGKHKPPCQGLRFKNKQALCVLVETEVIFKLEPLLARALGIGRGCCNNEKGITVKELEKGQGGLFETTDIKCTQD